LKEKQKVFRQKLDEKREMIRVMTLRLKMARLNPDEAEYQTEQTKLEQMQGELKELEKLEKEFIGTTGSKLNLARDNLGMTPRLQSTRNLGEPRRSITEKRVTVKLPRLSIGSMDDTDDPRILKMRIKMLETELENEKKLTEATNARVILLEKDNSRLEEEAKRLRENDTQWKDISNNPSTIERKWDTMDMLNKQDMDLDTVQRIQQEINSSTKVSKLSLEDRRKDVESKLKEVEMDIEEHTMKQKTHEIELMERRLKKRSQFLEKMEGKSKKVRGKLGEEDEEDEEEEFTDTDSEQMDLSIDSEEGRERRLKSPKPNGENDAKFDMLVVKLEKLDKLDELIRKMENMKYVGPGDVSGGGGTTSGRGYNELKQELDDLQKVIFDVENKYSEKEKEDANIKYEKTFTEYSQTSEYKLELAQAQEEKRKQNEPLNKEALEKMRLIYNPDSIKNNPEIRDRVLKNPELSLIGMDPKAILSKHQNDFSQYLLRITDISELRAIRGSLPKFRNDQKRQQEWLEILESKIEQVAKAPPKKSAPPKPAAAKLWKPKPPPKAGGPPTDMFAELLAKRNKIDLEGGESKEESKAEEPAPAAAPLEKKSQPSRIKLAPMKSPTAPTPPSAPAAGGPPPPPPPPTLHF